MKLDKEALLNIERDFNLKNTLDDMGLHLPPKVKLEEEECAVILWDEETGEFSDIISGCKSNSLVSLVHEIDLLETTSLYFERRDEELIPEIKPYEEWKNPLRTELIDGTSIRSYVPKWYVLYTYWHGHLISRTKYEENPSDWFLSYLFVDSHPAFWFRDEYELGGWNTGEGMTRNMWTSVGGNNAGDPVVMLEHGQSVPPDHTRHYHDHRLDVWAPDLNQAAVQFAANVYKTFDLWGESKSENYSSSLPL